MGHRREADPECVELRLERCEARRFLLAEQSSRPAHEQQNDGLRRPDVISTQRDALGSSAAFRRWQPHKRGLQYLLLDLGLRHSQIRKATGKLSRKSYVL